MGRKARRGGWTHEPDVTQTRRETSRCALALPQASGYAAAMKPLDSTTWVAGQIDPADVAAAAAAGIRRIVNTRPDGEAPQEPQGSAIAAAAAAQGLDYRYIPVGPSGFTPEAIAAMRDLLAQDVPTLAYCRSGTRSTLLWALARASAGADPADLNAAARSAGYDLAPVATAMAQLRSR